MLRSHRQKLSFLPPPPGGKKLNHWPAKSTRRINDNIYETSSLSTFQTLKPLFFQRCFILYLFTFRYCNIGGLLSVNWCVWMWQTPRLFIGHQLCKIKVGFRNYSYIRLTESEGCFICVNTRKHGEDWHAWFPHHELQGDEHYQNPATAEAAKPVTFVLAAEYSWLLLASVYSS